MNDRRRCIRLWGPALAVAALGLAAAPADAGKEAEDAQLLPASANTVAGPGLFTTDKDGRGRVFEVLSGGGADVCITVRTLSRTAVDIRVPGEPDVEVQGTTTKTRCYAAPARISLDCRGRSCRALWRVDRL